MGRSYPIQVALAGPQLAPPVQLLALEVVQVVQNLKHDVPLVAGKKTVLRCYLSVPPGTAPVSCRGETQLQRADQMTFQVASLNAVSVGPLPAAGVRALREDLAKSLNFLLPKDAFRAGKLTIRLDSITPDSSSAVSPAAGSAGPLVVTFSATPPLRVKLFSIRHTSGNPPKTYLPSARDRALTLSWLKRAYPVPAVFSSHAVINAPKPWPFECDDVNLQLAAIRRQDMAAGGDPRTHYFGMVADGGGRFFMRGCAADIPDHPAPDTVASGPVGPGTFGWDNDGSYGDWYSGHELGHTFGRAHPGFCDGNSADDPSYPFQEGKLANPDGEFVGMDVGDPGLGIPMAALPGVKWADVMTYCEYQWMGSYTLKNIHERLNDENAAFSGALPAAVAAAAEAGPADAGANLIHVLASLDLKNGTGKIVSVQPVNRGSPSRPTPDSPAVLELFHGPNQRLLSHPARIKKSSCCEGEDKERGMIDALLIAPPQTSRVRLVYRGQTVDSFEAGPDPAHPAVAAAMAEPPETPGTFYTVQVSADGGNTWETLGAGLKSPVIRIPVEHYAVPRLLVRTLTTNGFKTVENIREVTTGQL